MRKCREELNETSNNKKGSQAVLDKGSNLLIARSIIKILVIFLFSIAYFCMSLIEFLNYLDKSQILINEIEATQQYITNQAYVCNGFRVLVSFNATTQMLNQNIADFLNERGNYLADISGHVNRYRRSDGQIDPLINHYLSGDICPLANVNQTDCEKTADGAANKGLIRYAYYFTSTVNLLNSKYAAVRYTNYSAAEILNTPEFVQVEFLFTKVVRTVSIQLTEVILHLFVQFNDDRKNMLFVYIGGFLSILGLLVIIFWWPEYKQLLRRQHQQKDVFRLIPIEIVMKNKIVLLNLKKCSNSERKYD